MADPNCPCDEPIIAEGPWVASRFVLTGTHRGEFYGIPATRRTIEISGVDLLRIHDGQIAEWIYHEDTLSIFRQLGHMPAQDERRDDAVPNRIGDVAGRRSHRCAGCC